MKAWTRKIEAEQHTSLVLPYGEPSATPIGLQHLTWRHLATTRMDDRLLALSKPVIRAQMDGTGDALVTLAP